MLTSADCLLYSISVQPWHAVKDFLFHVQNSGRNTINGPTRFYVSNAINNHTWYTIADPVDNFVYEKFI
jgi:hypothetical protein